MERAVLVSQDVSVFSFELNLNFMNLHFRHGWYALVP